MKFLSSSICALVVLLSSVPDAFAHSQPARPLKRVAHPSTIALEIFPRSLTPPALTSYSKRNLDSPRSKTLRYDDSFRLVVSAFGQDYYLHLRPNDNLIHPAARITYHNLGPDGELISHSVPLLRESVKAYWGEVIPAHLSPDRLREDAAGVWPRPAGSGELGWARIMVHHQGDVDQGLAPVFEGAFSVLGNVHHIMTKENYVRHRHPLDPDISRPLDDALDSPLVIWRESDVMSSHEEEQAGTHARPETCGHDSLPFNTDPALNPALQAPMVLPWYDPLGIVTPSNASYRRDDVGGSSGMGTNFASSIGNTAGCPSTQKVLYMGVAADCQYTTKYGSQEKATTQILNNWNTASSLYKSSFNVSLGIIELQVQNATCPKPLNVDMPWNVDCSSVNLSDRLSLFSQWRGNKGSDSIGLWHLMSGCPTGTEVGIAWLATLCQQKSSGSGSSVVSGTAVSTAGRTEWQVVAHETGHNFGAIHDCASGCTLTDACCPSSASSCDAGAKFIMSPVSQSSETLFSPCSLGNVCSLMAAGTDDSCLVDAAQARATISLQMCGNGIVEAGEDCDPGAGVTSSCCNSSTCKFRTGAVCDPESSPCCTEACSFAPTTRICRPSKDASCDSAEMCTGNSSSCPSDTVAPNGQSCGANELRCASGQCTSVAKQCQTVGASMNLEKACPSRNDNTCQVSCQDPRQANQCILLQSMLVDGSPCGYGGICASGKCQAGDFLETAKAWYTQNLQISIPVTVAAGIVGILLLWAIIRAIMRGCCGSRQRPATVVVPPPVYGHHQQQSSVGGMRNSTGPLLSQQPQYPPPPNHYGRQQPNSQWVDAGQYNGPRG